jgi:hypothetical protein
MEDQDRWRRWCDDRPTAHAANDRGRAASKDMEIVRSYGDSAIVRLLRRDRNGDRRPLRRATR